MGRGTRQSVSELAKRGRPARAPRGGRPPGVPCLPVRTHGQAAAGARADPRDLRRRGRDAVHGRVLVRDPRAAARGEDDTPPGCVPAARPSRRSKPATRYAQRLRRLTLEARSGCRPARSEPVPGLRRRPPSLTLPHPPHRRRAVVVLGRRLGAIRPPARPRLVLPRRDAGRRLHRGLPRRDGDSGGRGRGALARAAWCRPRERGSADCTISAARKFGITGAIHTQPDYTVPQAWAEAFAAAGFGGIRYRVSHDPAQREARRRLVRRRRRAVAARSQKPNAIPASVIEAARQRFRLIVAPTPG